MTAQDLRNLIGAGKTPQTIDHLRSLSHLDNDNQNAIALLANRFATIQREKNLSLVSNQDANIEFAKINAALLSVIEEIGDENLNVKTSEPENMSNNTETKKSLFTFDNFKSTIAILAGIAGILTFYFKFCSNSSSEGENTNITVFVEDKNHDLILKNQGYVIMETEGGEAKREAINEKGAAPFQNVKVCSNVTFKIDFSEPYRPVKPDSQYIIKKDARIHLVAELQHLGKVVGTVFYKDQPLQGVIVETLGLRDTTDAMGSYMFNIPEGQQRKDPEVKFFKQGFKMAIKKAYPQTNEPLNIVMEK